MLDRFIEVLLQFGESLLPVAIIRHYEMGVLLRCGKFHRQLSAGLIWKIPLFDEVIKQIYVPTTIRLNPQSLFTKDGKQIVIRAIIKYEIDDIQKFLLEVTDAHDAICDLTQGKIKDVVNDTDYENLILSNNDSTITSKAKGEANKWGIRIHKVTVVDLGSFRSFRLMNDNNILTT
jgi:regulator of protease activity HflC (stomatin/prohibitin superfamily)